MNRPSIVGIPLNALCYPLTGSGFMNDSLRERDYGVLIVSPARDGVNRGSRRARVACSKL
jgi:hypothetical protein